MKKRRRLRIFLEKLLRARDFSTSKIIKDSKILDKTFYTDVIDYSSKFKDIFSFTKYAPLPDEFLNV